MNSLRNLIFGGCISLLINYCICSSDNTYCNSEGGCANTTVDNENIYCRGYKSCARSDVISEEYACMWGELAGHNANITTDYNAYCHGLFGCLSATLTITNDFYSYGYAASAKTTISMKDDAKIRGAYGIYDSSIEGENEDFKINGYASGMYATIDDFETIYAYGFLSLYYSDVYSGGDNKTFKLLSYGYYSGYGSNIYCEGYDTCKIKCDSTGCDGMTVYYSSTSTLTVSCSSDCATCPNTTEYSSMTELKKTKEYNNRLIKKNELKKWTNKELKMDNININKLNNINYFEGINNKNPRIKHRNKNLGYKILKHHNLDIINFENDEFINNGGKSFAVINDNSININNNNYSSLLFLFGKSLMITLIAGLLSLFIVKNLCNKNKYQQV